MMIVTATPTLVVPTFEGVFVQIPKIALESPVTPRDILGGKMEAPNGPEELASYDFADWPELGDPIVLAGHLDYEDYGPAIFARLEELALWDEIYLWKDGVREVYRVHENELHEAVSLAVDEVLDGSSDLMTLTLITCAGEFDTEIGHYDQRRIVRAVRVE
jgi:sortase (surface protein transpeptidase)